MGLVSKQCVDFVKEFEGFYSNPYYDIVGVKTLGYGMTGKEIEGLNYVSEQQASKMLEDLLNNKYALPIKNDLDKKSIVLNQNQFDALVSMAYNIGIGGLLGSTLYKNICNGVRDKDTITTNFQSWSNAGGKRVEGLFRRRTEEAKMFFNNGNKIEGVVKKVKNLVVYNFGADERAAEYLADYLSCPTIAASRPFDYSVVENVYAVGGKKENYTTYVKQFIAGRDRFDTMQAVLNYINKK